MCCFGFLAESGEQHNVVYLRPTVNISSISSRHFYLIQSCSLLTSLAQTIATRITSSCNIMHDMPRIITYTTSSVLRVCAHEVRHDRPFSEKTAMAPSIHTYHITQSRRKVKPLCELFPAYQSDLVRVLHALTHSVARLLEEKHSPSTLRVPKCQMLVSGLTILGEITTLSHSMQKHCCCIGHGYRYVQSSTLQSPIHQQARAVHF